MSFRTKQRIVKAILVVLALWPLIHLVVVHSTGLSPWRGFGWGMYTVPVLNVDVRIRHIEGHSGQPAPESRAATERAAQGYLKRYQALGAHAKPDQLAKTVFATYPGFKVIEIVIKQNTLDRETAHIVEYRSDQFRYRNHGEVVRIPVR